MNSKKAVEKSSLSVQRTYTIAIDPNTARGSVLELVTESQLGCPKGVKSKFWEEFASLLDSMHFHRMDSQILLKAIPEDFLRSLLELYVPTVESYRNVAYTLDRLIDSDSPFLEVNLSAERTARRDELFWEVLKPALEEPANFVRQKVQERAAAEEAKRKKSEKVPSTKAQIAAYAEFLGKHGYMVTKQTTSAKRSVEKPVTLAAIGKKTATSR